MGEWWDSGVGGVVLTCMYLDKLSQSKRVELGQTSISREQSSHHLHTDVNTALHALNG